MIIALLPEINSHHLAKVPTPNPRTWRLLPPPPPLDRKCKFHFNNAVTVGVSFAVLSWVSGSFLGAIKFYLQLSPHLVVERDIVINFNCKALCYRRAPLSILGTILSPVGSRMPSTVGSFAVPISLPMHDRTDQ